MVVEDSHLFEPAYPSAILVPLADAPELAIADQSVPIEPTPENGCGKPCRAQAHAVATTSKGRIAPTTCRITTARLEARRELIGLAIGLGTPPTIASSD